MYYLDLTLSSLAENLALEETLLLEAESATAREILRVWEWPRPAVVLGSACQFAQDIDEQACLADGVPILRRSSGGGTVLLGKGCLCFTLILDYNRSPALREIAASYAFILEAVKTALASKVPGIEQTGTSDLALRGKKVSGNSQQRKSKFLLHHGTLLYNFDIARVGRYLRLPDRQPEYRKNRDHADFLANLPCAGEELKAFLASEWNAVARVVEWPRQTVKKLVAEKYENLDWIRRR